MNALQQLLGFAHNVQDVSNHVVQDATNPVKGALNDLTHGALFGPHHTQQPYDGNSPYLLAPHVNPYEQKRMPLGPNGRPTGPAPKLPTAPLQVVAADNGSAPLGMWNSLQRSTSFDGGLQGSGQDDSIGMQGGMVNPGYVPFQAGQNPQMLDQGLRQILNRY